MKALFIVYKRDRSRRGKRSSASALEELKLRLRNAEDRCKAAEKEALRFKRESMRLREEQENLAEPLDSGAADRKVQALQKLHRMKSATLMKSIEKYKVQLMTLEQQTSDSKMVKRIKALQRALKAEEDKGEIAKKELGQIWGVTNADVDTWLAKASAGGPRRFRPKTREELQVDLVTMEKKWRRAEMRQKGAMAKARMLSSSDGRSMSARELSRTGSRVNMLNDSDAEPSSDASGMRAGSANIENMVDITKYTAILDENTNLATEVERLNQRYRRRMQIHEAEVAKIAEQDILILHLKRDLEKSKGNSKKMEELHVKVDHLSADVEHWQQQCEMKERELHHLREQGTSDSLDSRRQSLQHEQIVRDLKEELERMKQKLSERDIAISGAKNSRVTATQIVKRELEEARQELVKVKQERNKMEQRLQSMTAKAAMDGSKFARNLQAQAERDHAKLADIHRELISSQKEVTKYKGEAAGAAKRVEILEEQLRKSEAHGIKAAEKVGPALAKKEVELERMRKEILAMTLKAGEDGQKIDQLKSELSDKVDALRKSEERCAEGEEEVKLLKATVSNLTGEVEELKEDLEKLGQEADNSQHLLELESKIVEIGEKNQKIRELQNQASALKLSKLRGDEKHQATLDDMKSKIEELQNALAEKQREIDSNESKLAQAEAVRADRQAQTSSDPRLPIAAQVPAEEEMDHATLRIMSPYNHESDDDDDEEEDEDDDDADDSSDLSSDDEGADKYMTGQ
eukprot:g2444.t1